MSQTAPASGILLGAPVPGGPALKPTRVTLEGRHVHVAAFDAARHAGDLYALSHGPDREQLWAFLSNSPFPDLATFERTYAEAATLPDPLFFAIEEADSGRTVGHASYMRIAPEHRVIEVGNILFTLAIQRSVGATEAMYLMARHAFEDLGYRRYEWKCDALNTASRRAAERLGFTFEGVFRQHMIRKGRNRDTAWHALLDHEWPRAKAALEAWLSPENFDAEGRQLRRLEAIRAGL